MRKFALLATLVLIMVFILATYLNSAQETDATGDGESDWSEEFMDLLDSLGAESNSTSSNSTPTPL